MISESEGVVLKLVWHANYTPRDNSRLQFAAMSEYCSLGLRIEVTYQVDGLSWRL